MIQRCHRKKDKVAKLMWSKYSYSSATPELQRMAKDICNTFKVLIYKELIFKATPRDWISLWFNAGAQIMAKTIFDKLKNQDILPSSANLVQIIYIYIYDRL